MIVPFLVFGSFLVLVVLLGYIKESEARHQVNQIKQRFSDRVLLQVLGAKSATFSSGAKGAGVHFSTCDLFITSDAWIVIGYSKIFSFTTFASPVVLSTNHLTCHCLRPFAIVAPPKKINIRSFDAEIYIEFTRPTWITTTIEFRLKGISEDDKLKMEALLPTNIVI